MLGKLPSWGQDRAQHMGKGYYLSDKTTDGQILTPTQVTVLSGLALGLNHKTIHSVMNISNQTLKNHVLAIHNRLKVRNTIGAIIKAHKLGIIDFYALHGLKGKHLVPKYRFTNPPMIVRYGRRAK